jgi:Ni,Fe-hydrogenase I large subunit
MVVEIDVVDQFGAVERQDIGKLVGAIADPCDFLHIFMSFDAAIFDVIQDFQ